MRFLTIDPWAYQPLAIVEAADVHAALAMVGLDPMETDHGMIRGAIGQSCGLGIVVYEWGLMETTPEQRWFTIGAQLFAGKAVIYGFDQAGETVSVPHDLPSRLRAGNGAPVIGFYDTAQEVERAIGMGAVQRPQASVSGSGKPTKVYWRWPEPRPAPEAIRAVIGAAIE